jgi:hypothetical protein
MTEQQTIIIKNDNGLLEFDADGVHTVKGLNYTLSTDDFYSVTANDYIVIQNNNNDFSLISDNGQLLINSNQGTSNAILINASNTVGGITMLSGSNGISQIASNGDINILSQGADINIGVSPIGTPAIQQTQNLNLECYNVLSVNAADMYFVSSDVISFISNTGDIEFGTSNGSPIIKFQDGNLLINQSSSILDRQVDIAVTRPSLTKPGYNGLVVNSFLSNTASDLTLQTSNSISNNQCILSLGAFPGSDNYSIFQSYLGYQSSNVVIRLDGPSYSPNRSSNGFGVDFTYSDIGKQLYFPLTNRKTIITGLGTQILGNNDLSNITVTGTYTGNISRVYLIQIDSVGGNPDTFMWSNDGGVTFQQTFIPISISTINLDNGLAISFSTTTGFSLYQQFIFQAKITAYVDSVVPVIPSIPEGEPFYSLQPYFAYLGTETPSDLVIKTNNMEKMRITGDGAVSIQENNPTACLGLDSNYNKVLVVNQISPGYQVNPSISQLNSGGYVIVWNNQNLTIPNTSIFDVFGQCYMTDGTRYKTSFKINKSSNNYQSFPWVAGQEIKDSSKYAVVWSSNVSGTFNIYSQVYNYNEPVKAFDILVGTGSQSLLSLDNQPYPKIAGLYNGNFIITWVTIDPGTGLSIINGRIMTDEGNFATSIFQISTLGASTSRNYPYVAGLPSNDPYVPNGFVTAFMVKVDTNIDSRYTISMKLYNSNGTPHTNEIPITSIGSLSFSSITDGLVSVAEINNTDNFTSNTNGGFIITFYRNYEADTTLYNVSDPVTGSQSGATATISSLDPNNRIITLQNVSNRFLVSEEITIGSTVPNIGNVIEKIKNIDFLTSSTADITLDTGYHNVTALRFNSNVTTVTDNLWTIQVNTSELFEDLDRINVPSNSTVFSYKRPLAAVAINNTGTAAITWSNGSIPSVYYQLLDVQNGAKIGQEMRLTSQYDGLKQRDQVIAHLQSIQGNDFGFVISWDNQNLDLSDAGVYQQLIGYGHNIIQMQDGNNDILLNHDGQLGVGTYNPTATLHVQSSQTSDFNDPANPVSMVLQNTSKHIITPTIQQSITFENGNSNILGNLQVTHSLKYNDLYPQPDNLIGFYKFDESIGTQVPDSSSSSTNSNPATLTYVNTNGILVNFDIENCWVNGLINNCLAFDGVNNYVFVEPTSTNSLNTVLETAKSITLSLWINVASNVVTGQDMNLISNGGNVALSGTYLLSLVDQGSNGMLYPQSKIVVDSATLSPPGTIITANGNIPINDGNWHLLNMVSQVGASGYSKLYIDGLLSTTTSFSNTITYTQHTGETTVFGCSNINDTSNFFRGYMDELRIYDSVLTNYEINQLYEYGSQSRGSVIISANNDNNINTAMVLDDTGKFNNMNCKPLPYSVLSGIITAYFGNTTITGVNTLFTQQLMPGDIIILDTATNIERTIISVENDSAATLNIRGYNGPNVSKAYQSVLRKPNVISFYDNGDNVKGFMNNYGNLVLGNGVSNSILAISSSSNNNNSLPNISLNNIDQVNTSFGRKTTLNFTGYNANIPLSNPVTLANISSSHYGTGTDNCGCVQIDVNNGTNVNTAMTITSNSKVSIGGENNPLALLHLYRTNENTNIVLQSGYPQLGSVYDESSTIYFGGVQSITQTVSTNINDRMLAAIKGSNDSNTLSLDGKLDFMTNNITDNTNGLETRMTISRQGNVGVGIQQSVNLLQVAPELRIGYNINTISSVTSNTSIEISQNIFIDYISANKAAQLVGATVILGTSTLLTCKIVSITSPNTMVVDTNLTPYVGYTIYVNFAGLNMSSIGFTGVNTTSPNTILTVNGGISKPIKTITSNLNLDKDDMLHTILCDSTSGTIIVTLPSTITNSLYGRLYTIKRIGSNIVTIQIAGGDTALIDGSSSVNIATLYDVRQLQCDGSNWWLL